MFILEIVAKLFYVRAIEMIICGSSAVAFMVKGVCLLYYL